MRSIIRAGGTAAYWLGWPFLWVYFRLRQRTRILLVCGDKVLVVSGWIGHGQWILPGGGLGKTEDPYDGVLRELREEVGISSVPRQSVHMLGTSISTEHYHRYAYFQFLALVPSELPIRKQWHEIAAAEWVDYRQLTPHNAARHVLDMVAAWQASGKQ